MKKINLLFVLLVSSLTACIFTSCSKDEEDLLIGTWRYDDYELQNAYITLTFNANKTGQIKGVMDNSITVSFDFTYTYSNNIIAITPNSDAIENLTLTVMSITKDELTINDNGEILTLRRV